MGGRQPEGGRASGNSRRPASRSGERAEQAQQVVQLIGVTGPAPVDQALQLVQVRGGGATALH